MAKLQKEVGSVCFTLIIFGELHRLWSFARSFHCHMFETFQHRIFPCVMNEAPCKQILFAKFNFSCEIHQMN